MTRAELAKTLAKKTNISLSDAEKLIVAFGDTITEVLGKGEKAIYSNFGTFYTVHYPSKVIFHPVLGIKKKMVMLPTNAVKWMPSNNIKDMVNLGRQIDKPTSFGATKGLNEKKIKEGLPTKKSEEIELNEDTSSVSEEYDIPVKVSSKNKLSPTATATASDNIWADLMSDNKSTPKSEKTDSDPETKLDAKKVSLLDAGIFQPQNKDFPKQEVAPEIPKEEKAANPTIDHGFDKPVDQVQGIVQPASETLPAESQPETNTPAEPDLQPFKNFRTTISYVDLSKSTVSKEVLQLIPERIAREYKVVPVELNDTDLTLAMVDPEDIETIELVKRITQKKITPKLTTEDDLQHVLNQYQGFESEVKEAIQDVSAEEEEETEKDSKEALSAATSTSAPAARIVSSLLKRAFRDKASDIHIEPLENEVVVRFRIDGILHKKVTLPKDIQNALVSRIKILSNLKIDEQRLPQDGRFGLKLDGQKIDFRVSTMPVANGEKIVMRVLDKVSGVIAIDKIGLRERDFRVLGESCEKSHGMILVTGPTGSGKTTTLYALIDKIYTEGINIITLEDPIEYQMSGINQSQVNPEIDYTFASGLRSILRQDPDVVMIGEIRDKETAEMAVHAALTGHVVLSTLHTNDAPGAIPRLIDMGVEPFLLNSSLNLVIGQRLARKICDSCKEEITLDPKVLSEVKKELEKLPPAEKKKVNLDKLKFYRGKGCKDCENIGYHGRIGLYEILVVSEEIKRLSAQQSASSEMKNISISEGMTTLIQDGILKAMEGLTTIEEVWRVTKE